MRLLELEIDRSGRSFDVVLSGYTLRSGRENSFSTTKTPASLRPRGGKEIDLLKSRLELAVIAEAPN